MFSRLPQSTPSHVQVGATPLAHGQAIWRRWLTLVALLSYLALLGFSASHDHASSLSEDECAVCSLVSDNISELSALPAVATEVTVLQYHILVGVVKIVTTTSPRRLPSICGPPLQTI